MGTEGSPRESATAERTGGLLVDAPREKVVENPNIATPAIKPFHVGGASRHRILVGLTDDILGRCGWPFKFIPRRGGYQGVNHG